MSKIVPNTTQTPNLYLDKLLLLLDEGELKTLLYAVRRTMGFHKGSDRISISQFMNGNRRVDENGELVEYGTGLSKSTQIAVLKRLVGFGLLMEVSPNEANRGAEWALQLDDRQVQWDALWDRHGQRKNRASDRTQHGREAAASKRQGGLSIEPLAGGLTVRPQVVQPLDRQVVYPLDTQKKERKPEENIDNNSDENLQIAWGMLVSFCGDNQDTAVRLWQLQSHLATVSRLPLPDIDTEHGRADLQTAWWPVLLDIDQKAGGDLVKAKAGMDTAVAEIDAWKPEALQAPRSILKKTIAYFAAAQRGAANGNGHMAQPSYAQYKI